MNSPAEISNYPVLLPKRLAKYRAMFLIAVKDASFHTDKLITQLLMLGFRVGVLLALYKYTFQYFGKSSLGVDFVVTSWGIVFYFIIFSFNLRYVSMDIDKDIYSGNIELFITKPFRYIVYVWMMRLGKGVIDGMVTLVVACILLSFFVGFPAIPLSLGWFAYAFIIFIMGIALVLALYSCIGLSAFWIEDSKPLFWIVDKAIMILGGAYVPVALFPAAMKLIALYSPFGATMFITHIFYADFMASAPKLIGILALWLAGTLVLLGFLQSRAKQRMFVNGG